MTYSEYKERKAVLFEEYKKADRELQAMYIKLNNTVRTGDIITDHVGSILVDKLILGYSERDVPQAVYEGVILNKDGKPNKRGERRRIFKCNLI